MHRQNDRPKRNFAHGESFVKRAYEKVCYPAKATR